jgi:1-acyl-sn-glycerol-3-phosphate acyltransferase
MQQRMTFWYLLGYSLSKALAKTFFNYRVIGAENMIEEGPCIIAANHCSYLDPPLVGVACKRAIHYLARKSLLDVPVLGPILPQLNVIPVDQKNADRSALMGAIRVVRNGGAVLLFPEGTRSPDGTPQEAQPGIGMIVAKTGAPVVPVKIKGSFTALPRHVSLPRCVPVIIEVGERVSFGISSTQCSKEIYSNISNLILEKIGNVDRSCRLSCSTEEGRR